MDPITEKQAEIFRLIRERTALEAQHQKQDLVIRKALAELDELEKLQPADDKTK